MRAWRIIWFKELTETLRDRKTLLIMVVLPLVLYPLLFIGMTQATMMQQEELQREQLSVGIAGAPAPPELDGALRSIEATEVVQVADPEAAVQRGEVVAALVVDEDAAAALRRGDQAAFELLFDGGSDRSREAERRLRHAVEAYASDLRRERLDAVGIRDEYIEPVQVAVTNVAPPERQGGWLLGQILPLLVSMLMIGATFYPAIDLTAGEKERGTLQTLLTAPIGAGSIVAGKFLAVVTLALITGAMNLASVAFVALGLDLPEEVVGQISFDFSADVLLLMLVCLLLMGMMFGAVMMAVAVTAKSFKEAQNYLTPLYIACIFPLMLAGLPGVELTMSTAAIPLVNLALAMKQLLLGPVPAELLAVTFLSTIAFIALALVLAARVFRMEAVLLGDQGLKALFQRRTTDGIHPPIPTLGEVVTLLGVVLLLLFYGSLALKDAPLLAIIHVTQWGLLLLPVLLVVFGLKLSPRDTLALRRPPAWGLASAALLGAGLWFIASVAIEALADDFMPLPSRAMEALESSMAALAAEPLGAVLLYGGVAIAPAICEEALFRGVVLQSFAGRYSARTAVLVSALLFAVYHMNPYQLPVTFLIGLLLGSLTVTTRSIWPAVLLHALHNGLTLTFSLPLAGVGPPSSLLAVFFVAAPVVGLALLLYKSVKSRQPVSR